MEEPQVPAGYEILHYLWMRNFILFPQPHITPFVCCFLFSLVYFPPVFISNPYADSRLRISSGLLQISQFIKWNQHYYKLITPVILYFDTQ
jgi:hypothetical protein